MIMKILVTLTLTTISILSFAQTDIIEMRSRNTSLKKYERISKGDHVVSNFGMIAMEEVKNAVLDSVTAISDTVAIMYTSVYCTGIYRVVGDYYGQRDLDKTNYISPRVGELWQPGADTVVNHPLFSHIHSLDSVKEVLDKDYHFKLPSDSIEFIGYDNVTSSTDEEIVMPAKVKNVKKNSFGWELIFIIVTPILFLLFMSKFFIPSTANHE